MLLDLNMPVMSGDEALKTLKGEFPGARIIMLSSLADRDSVEECLNMGAVNYIRKDCSFNEMTDIIRESLHMEKPQV